MRQVPRDDKWRDEREANDLRRGAADAEDATAPVQAATINTGPSEHDLAVVALLMRLYDVGMAILHSQDEELAAEVYELHEKGLHKNPPIYIPTLDSTDDA